MTSLILSRITRVVVHIIFLFSIFILFKGHHEPGGGFIAGLMTSVAIVLVYISYDIQTVRKIIRFPFSILISLGLFFAAGTGLGSIILGFPFLTHTFGYFDLPLLGTVELTSGLSFDVGVYLVVVGATLLIISSLGGESR